MSREYLFRGKTEDRIWFEGSLHQYTIVTPSKTEKHYKIQEFHYGYQDEAQFDCDYMCGFDEEVIPETVGEYAGWKDKNGKKIFEGDIVKFTDTTFGYSHIGEVCFDKGSFCILYEFYGQKKLHRIGKTDKWQDMGASGTITYSYEVIGNIIDNKELLGE